MPRGIPWNDLPRPYPFQNLTDKPINSDIVPAIEMVEEKDVMKDIMNVGRRFTFGVVCGSMTGATFAIVDILRDVKAISTKRSVAIAMIGRYSGLFGAFFGCYHSMRKILKLTVPLSPETNLIASGTVCITPLLFHRTLRPMIPYSAVLVGLDAVNGLYDI